MALFYALLGAIFAGITNVVAKITLKEMPPLWVAGIKSFIMTILLITFAYITSKEDIKAFADLHSKAVVGLAVMAIAGALAWVFSFYALQKGNTTEVVAIDKTSILFVTIFAMLFLGEKLEWYNIVGILLIAGGAILSVL
jgi:transporter family protein